MDCTVLSSRPHLPTRSSVLYWGGCWIFSCTISQSHVEVVRATKWVDWRYMYTYCTGEISNCACVHILVCRAVATGLMRALVEDQRGPAARHWVVKLTASTNSVLRWHCYVRLNGRPSWCLHHNARNTVPGWIRQMDDDWLENEHGLRDPWWILNFSTRVALPTVGMSPADPNTRGLWSVETFWCFQFSDQAWVKSRLTASLLARVWLLDGSSLRSH